MRDENHPMEFYVGYEPRMPRGLARIVRRAAAAAVMGGLIAAMVVLGGQRRLPDARFEYGRFQEYHGVISMDPYPRLHVETRDGRAAYWLAAPGKHGAEQLTAGWAGRLVRLDGAIIERNERRMLELRPGSIRSSTIEADVPIGNASLTPHRVTLRGEIVDSKCFLGVMNPSEGAVHRDCAVACLRGGLPPMLLLRNRGGRETLVVLIATDGGSASRSLAGLAGRRVEATGMLVEEGRDYGLRVESVELMR